MSATKGKHKQILIASLLAVVLLGSSMLSQNFIAYADKGGIPNEHSDHKKPKKDPDHDHDNDKKTCKHGDTNEEGKYRHSCDSDHDFK